MPEFQESIHEGTETQETAGRRVRLPVPLRFFLAYLITILPVIVFAQSAYLLLSDDWSFGLRSAKSAALAGYALFSVLVGQHLYRVFTIVALVARLRFAVSNAKIYLIASFVMIMLFSIMLESATGAGMALIPALGTTLPWWLYLSKSKRVRAFENDMRIG
jgi:hypothetical protein